MFGIDTTEDRYRQQDRQAQTVGQTQRQTGTYNRTDTTDKHRQQDRHNRQTGTDSRTDTADRQAQTIRSDQKHTTDRLQTDREINGEFKFVLKFVIKLIKISFSLHPLM